MTSLRRLVLPVLLPLLVAASGCGGDTKTPTAQHTQCSYTKGGPASKKVDLPPGNPAKDAPDVVTIATNRGDLKVRLDAEHAPCTVNSFLSLAEQKFFDGTKCHRLHIKDYFVLQCGDPTGTGQGGPGYQFDDEISGQETYTAGTLAMANGGPNTNGSQFFLVFADSPFPPSYTVFGHLNAAGVQLVRGIAKEGIGVPSNNPALGAGDGTPKNPVVIESVG